MSLCQSKYLTKWYTVQFMSHCVEWNFGKHSKQNCGLPRQALHSGYICWWMRSMYVMLVNKWVGSHTLQTVADGFSECWYQQLFLFAINNWPLHIEKTHRIHNAQTQQQFSCQFAKSSNWLSQWWMIRWHLVTYVNSLLCLIVFNNSYGLLTWFLIISTMESSCFVDNIKTLYYFVFPFSDSNLVIIFSRLYFTTFESGLYHICWQIFSVEYANQMGFTL